MTECCIVLEIEEGQPIHLLRFRKKVRPRGSIQDIQVLLGGSLLIMDGFLSHRSRLLARNFYHDV